MKLTDNQIIQNKISNQFLLRNGYLPNIYNPTSYNEKIQWYKIFYRNKIITKCSDKYAVREYVKEKIGEKYLIPLIAVYDDPRQIEFNKLPNRFVIKLNNGSGKNIICKNKKRLNIKKTISQLKNWLTPDNFHYYYSYEWAYKNIPPKLICEEYIEQNDKNLCDYKFFCFNGTPKFIRTFRNRGKNTKRKSYDLNWRPINISIEAPNSDNEIPNPKNLNEMIKISKILSKDFPLVRVDLYEVNDKVFFGELTFYPGSGLNPFLPIEQDFKIGKYLNLKKMYQKKVSKYLDYQKTRKAKVVIYTAISGNYENPKHHQYLSHDFDYICYTDQKVKNPGVWKIKPLKKLNYDQVRIARYYKVFPHLFLKKYKYSIWVDSNINVIDNRLEKKVYQLINKKKKISIGTHFERNCIYKEARACIENKKDDPQIIIDQVQFLIKNKYPKNKGLFESNIIFRNHHDQKIINTMEDWWSMITKFSRRDQLSLNYVIWKNKIKCQKLFNKNIRLMYDSFVFFNHTIKTISTLTINYQGEKEKDSIFSIASIKENIYKVYFNLSNFKNYKQVEIIITDKHPVQFKLNKIIINKQNVSLNKIKINNNGRKITKNLFWFTEPPKIMIKTKNIQNITILGEMIFQEQTQNNSNYDYEEYKKVKQDLKKIQSSKTYNIWQKYNNLKKIIYKK